MNPLPFRMQTKPHTRNHPVRARGRFALLFLLLCPAVLWAEMLYHIPFDDGSSYSRNNLGTVGGEAEAAFRTGTTGRPSVASNDVPPNLGPFSEDFARLSLNNEVGPALLLPDSRAVLLLDKPDDEISISAWVKWTPIKNLRQIILSKTNLKMETKGGTGWAFLIRPSGRLQFLLMGGVSDHTRNVSTQSLEPGRWHHVAVTVRAGDNQSTQMSIDGEEVDIADRHIGTRPAWPGDAPIALAANAPDLTADRGFTHPLNGQMDDVAVWNEVLPFGKIRALSTAPSAMPGLNASQMNHLFDLFDKADSKASAEIAGKKWAFFASIPNPRGEGESWTDAGRTFIQLDHGGAGVGTQ